MSFPSLNDGVTLPERVGSGNVAALFVADYDGAPLGILVTSHTGTPDGIRRANRSLRSRADRRFRSFSNINSRTLARLDGVVVAVSPNSRQVNPVDSLEGRATLGDPDAISELYG
jgi:hypothetical protein